MTEYDDIEDVLVEALFMYDEENHDGEGISSIRSYSDVGMMTSDNGIVLKLNDGSEFQITIIQTR